MLTVLDPDDPLQPFPSVSEALNEPNGLLAVGGCLAPARLESAYRHGIFPWYGAGEPILWWSPDPRLVLRPEHLVTTRSLRKLLRQGRFEFRFDTAFDAVIEACAEPRAYADSTWITPSMKRAYNDLHRLGLAHSFEVWLDGALVGGLYGVAIGRVFFGESMFHRVSNASKAAFVLGAERLQAWGYALIDCQVHTSHLEGFGAREVARSDFIDMLHVYCNQFVAEQAWCRP
ncbi:leucyl/phenylalanyl-tRNA--protein transferase [Methylococcus sp. EFPC2]|uniref:leucyl/phenylalanyl-tRNA--protein transferase n=1 Tax=Methylococcus sp. EFPC2 TaxID=2812648 RepID=UPI0019680CE3|nr:leucyl/phenylalanyl-tRNA--protein transferase [Methylococcus sp. EFPC2]QSA97450.1 leucyl/phenylalanyl-tRNA--protein transferase [Methylococcus sp. EFPC2]